MNDIYVGSLFSEAYLEHHGILGMKWGVRRFQREDGSLTSAGRKRKLVNEHKNEAEKKPGALKRAGHKALGKVGEKLKNSVLESAYRAVDKSDVGRYKRNAETADSHKGIIGRTKDNINAAKGRDTVGGKISELVGAGAKARKYQNQANYQKALSKSYLSSKNKANAARNARNSEQQAKYFDSVNKGKTKDTLRGRFNIPYEKANGKTTTRGKNYIAGVGKRAIKHVAVSAGKKALAVALVAGAEKMVDYVSTEEFNKKIKG